MPSFSLDTRHLPVVLLASACGLVVAACGADSSAAKSSTSALAPASTSSTGSLAAKGTPISVTLKDFSITLSRKLTKPGAYTFTVTNQGPASHNLTVSGPGVADQTTGSFSPSQGPKTLTVTLKQGSYDFFCSVPGHKQLGMNAQVMIGGGAASAGGSSGSTSTGGSSSSGGGWG